MADEGEEPVEEGRAVGDMGGGIVLGQEGGVGMTGNSVEPAAAEGLGAGREAVDLEVEELGDERGDGCLQEGVAGSDIHLVDIVGQTVDDSLKQSLVTEHNRCAPSVSDTLRGEPLADVTGLDILRRGRNEGDLLRRLFLGVLIEQGLALALQSAEKRLFHMLQEIETYKDVGVVVEGDGLVFNHLTVEGTLVGESLCSELFVEGVVDIPDAAPQTEEPLLEFAVVFVGEIAEEALYEFALLIGEIRHIIEFVDVTQVGEDAVGRTHVLVEVVEVGEQQLAPAIEVVERLVDARASGEALVEFADEQDGVGDLEFGVAAEEVADGDIGGTPQRTACQTGKVVVEEQRGTFVGEDYGDTGEVGAEAGEEVRGDVFKKRRHTYFLNNELNELHELFYFLDEVGVNVPEVALYRGER